MTNYILTVDQEGYKEMEQVAEAVTAAGGVVDC
jgi:hypothetical protein